MCCVIQAHWKRKHAKTQQQQQQEHHHSSLQQVHHRVPAWDRTGSELKLQMTQDTSFRCWHVFWLFVISKVMLVTAITMGVVRLLTLEIELPTVGR